ncbi:MAG: hypothetical protein O2816_15690 [Planctomycetota bacterium]|nr:hypothetical protein [Planctomycetota bacterium]
MRLAAACLLLATPSLADVLNVRGPQPDHQEIQAALDAASPGDVLRVWPGQYQIFSVTQSVTIVRATVNGVAEVQGTLRIRDLAAGATVELNGISSTGQDGPALIVSNCAGSVRLRECKFQGPYWVLWEAHPGSFVTNCADVAMTACESYGGSSAYGEGGGWGAEGLIAADSNVSLFASTFRGASGSTEDDPGASGGSGGHGVSATGSGFLWVAGSTLEGGHGSNADHDPDWFGGGYGSGGDGGWAHAGSMSAWIHDCDLVPGDGGWSPEYPGSPGQDTTGTLRPGKARLLRATGSLEDDAAITLRAEGTPGDEVWVRLADGPGYRFDPIRGPFLVETAAAPGADPWLRLGTIDASGVLLVELPTIDLPAFEHRVLHFQGVFLRGKNYFGSMTWSVLVDEAW